MRLTDERIREVAWATKSAEPGRDGYILPFTFARAIEAAVLAAQSEQPQGNLAAPQTSDVHGDTGRDFRVNGGILHFADGSSRAATAPEAAMWKMLQAAPIAGDTGREAPTVEGLMKLVHAAMIARLTAHLESEVTSAKAAVRAYAQRLAGYRRPGAAVHHPGSSCRERNPFGTCGCPWGGKCAQGNAGLSPATEKE